MGCRVLQPPSKHGESFGLWFEWILEAAEIYDYGRYPVKGMGVWLPYGFKIRKSVVELIRKLLDDSGHEEILLPLLIPETLFRKESEHVRGFEGEVLWVTRGGLEELDVKLALRPTSETSISFMESFWVKSYKQLPKKYYQVVSVFRYETKMTKPMIRVREVTTFKEAHTLHESFEDAERQVMEAIDIYRRFFEALGIPYIVTRRMQWDKFAGALYTIAFDTLFPDRKAVQVGTVHHLGQTFTTVFDVKIQRRDESIDFAWQTSYGISERVIASIIAHHSDERGLILPPIVAPYQVIVIPIVYQRDERATKVVEYSKYVAEVLKRGGFKVYLDLREELRPSEKFYEWEIKGAPVRVEVGAKELQGETVTLFRRDELRREVVPLNEAVKRVDEILKDITIKLAERAWRWFLENIKLFHDASKAVEFVKEGKGVAILPWCGDEDCAYKSLEAVEGLAVLGELLTITYPSLMLNDPKGLICPLCGRGAVGYIAVARRY